MKTYRAMGLELIAFPIDSKTIFGRGLWTAAQRFG
jgi:hypothetical protein